MRLTKLNIGGGYTKIEGFLNVDCRIETEPDFLVDLEKDNSLTYNPFHPLSILIADSSVDEVLMSHIFEHIRNIQGLMKEIYRVCMPSAKIRVICPYWSHRSAVEDPTHVRYMTERSMMYFSKNTIGSDGKPFVRDYDFKTIAVTLVPDKEYQYLSENVQELHKLGKKYLNVIEFIIYDLEVVK